MDILERTVRLIHRIFPASPRPGATPKYLCTKVNCIRINRLKGGQQTQSQHVCLHHARINNISAANLIGSISFDREEAKKAAAALVQANKEKSTINLITLVLNNFLNYYIHFI